MINFQTLKYKNFLSTGTSWTEVNLSDAKSTLVVGHNGAGKSTMLDALSFGLFGKPHRNINKAQLVNSINRKDCVVEVTFRIGKAQFKVVRAIRPNKFEIWKDGTMINQSSHAKEYQKILEQNIIKLNHKSFHQIVVLGSSSFIPFMQLPGQHRRDVIEDLLDINIFSKMNGLVKEKSSLLKDAIKELTYDVDLIKEKIVLQRKYIRDVENLSDEQVKDKQSQVDMSSDSISTLQTENNALQDTINQLNDGLSEKITAANNKKQSLLEYQATFNQQIKTVVKDAKFFEHNSECPTCSQDIETELRESKLTTAKTKATELNKALKDAREAGDVVTDTLAELNSVSKTISDTMYSVTSNNKEIARLQSNITDLNKAISAIQGNDGDINVEKAKLDQLQEDRDSKTENKLIKNEELSYNIAMAEMLKDTGIKTKIIKQYLPVINSLTNKYLQILDFFVHFNLDESFQETIRSRHRDDFSYDSFSEGEKQRIDLSLLFTWRQVAKMKNSVATNLLILDETFDSSLDHEGVDNLMKILYTLGPDTNVFVISHKGEILENKFEKKIEFVKEKNFSKMK